MHETDEVVERWRSTLDKHEDWSLKMKLRILTCEAEYHRRNGREKVAQAVEKLAREIAN